MIRDTDRRRGRGFLVVALAALGVLAATAGSGVAQAFRDDGWAPSLRPAAYQGRNWDRTPGPAGYPRRGPGAYGGVGYDGPPPGFDAPGRFRRGQVLPPDQRERYVDDPGRYHLRAPPNGYGWVGDGRNAYLMQRSTGMVLDSVPGAYEPAPRFGRGGRGGGEPLAGPRGGGRMPAGGGRGYGRGWR